MIDQNAAHLLTGNGEEMSTILDLQRFGAGQAQVCLVDQGGSLEGMPFPLMPHLAGSDAMEFPVNQIGHLIARLPVAGTHPVQERCNI